MVEKNGWTLNIIRDRLLGLPMPPDATFIGSTSLANDSCQCGDTMSQDKKVQGHLYTVELRFSGDQLEPSEISARLNLRPSKAFSQLQNQSTISKRLPYWGYNGQGEGGFKPEWESLEDGLDFLLKSLRSRKTEVITLAHEFDGLWWCGHFQASFNGGPTLSPKLLTEIGSYGMPLSIDNYFAEE
ncbi:uncharacterized protein DUF4279 [Methylovorus glucosotrophus]|uniref:DUF4279 domain-containing protein n=1 Tax=Methylovorus glucosotrophus TaxID=266009 RepID=UPI001B87C9C5|nr:DUF4279 domain-containing protein [Methylovorus glucosotrophus]KAF0843138.1 uncharacterized protein DUF4279 [Methylovorus glucosotrophus]